MLLAYENAAKGEGRKRFTDENVKVQWQLPNLKKEYVLSDSIDDFSMKG